MEIIQERLRREFNMDVISTYPSVIYEVTKTNGEELIVDNPSFLPEPQEIQEVREPMVRTFIMIPSDYIGDIMALVMEKRGDLTHTETIDTTRVMLTCELPLAEILVDFNDRMKSMTRGYGSMDYEHCGYRPAKMVKMDMLIAGEPVEAFSTIVHREKAESYGRQLALKLKEVIPQQLFVVAIQACVGGKIMLRRRHLPQTQTVRKTKERQRKDESLRKSQHPPRSLHQSPQKRLTHRRAAKRYADHPMNILLSLLSRIAGGERLEKGSKENTAYWLSTFAILPVWILGSVALMGYLNSKLNGVLTDNRWFLILFSVLACLPLILCIVQVAKLLYKHPLILLLTSIISWGATAWYAITRLA